MAINFQAAAFLAGLTKVPSQIMYCISQDTGVPAPVVVYSHKDANAQTMAQLAASTTNTPLWSTSANQSEIYNGAMHHKTVQNLQNPPANHSVQVPQIPIPPQSNIVYPPSTTHIQHPPQHTLTYGHSNLHSQIIQSPTTYAIQFPSGQIYTTTTAVHNHHVHSNEKNNKSNENQNISDSGHNEEKQFACAACNKTFRLKSTLIQHERIHLDSRPFMCNFDNSCQKSFRQKSHLIQHSRIHFDSKPFTCRFSSCGKSFRQKAILSQHERIHCDTSSKLLYKNVGDNATLWPFDVPYPVELENKDSPNRKDNFPPLTHSVFGNLTDIDFPKESTNSKSELNDKQGTMPQFVRCPICQISYKQKSTLLQHGCVHIESRPYPCLFLQCGKRFRQQSHLAQHIRIHKNEKPYQCPYPECQGRCFRQRTILNQHIRIHTNSKPYRCSNCGKDFRQQAILTQHEKTHLSHRPFSCPLSNCKRRFVDEHVSFIFCEN